MMVEEPSLSAVPDDLPKALWDLGPHAREAGGTHFHFLATDTTGSDLAIAQMARKVLPTLYREFSGYASDLSPEDAVGPMDDLDNYPDVSFGLEFTYPQPHTFHYVWN